MKFNEHTFEIDKVSPMWLSTALCVVLFGLYYLLGFLSPPKKKIPALEISGIYVYPIKSLRGVKLTEAVATQHGFQHDRAFMLLKKTAEGYKNMSVAKYPEMTQYFQEIDGYGSRNGTITITYRAFGDTEKATTLEIPLMPDTEKLSPFNVNLHTSPTPAFKMPEECSTWFSKCFGYDVVLVYIGDNKRAVLFEDMQPVEPDRLTIFLKNIPFARSYVEKKKGLHRTEQWKISFADCAPYLITSQTSLEDVSSRLPAGEDADMTKFRPNIVLKGAVEPYQEDYWGRVKINNAAEIIMAHNCVRCQSLNVDYATGKFGTGQSGQILKKLQSNRRVDVGAKWSPVFGRYAFWDPKYPAQRVRVGDAVSVEKVNGGLTVWSWPSLG